MYNSVKTYFVKFLLINAILFLAAVLAEAQSLIDYARSGDFGKVQQLLAQGTAVDVRDSQGRTPLLIATWENHPEVAKLLIDAGANVNAQDHQQDSAYLVAGAEGRTDILKMILKNGANIKSINRYGGTALIPACEHGHVDAVRLLIDAGVDVNHINHLGWTGLLEVVILGSDSEAHRQVVEMLIKAGADVNLADKDAITPLEHAKNKQFTGIIALLTQAGGR